jgi:allantoinase
VSLTLMGSLPQPDASRRAGAFAAVLALLVGVCFSPVSTAQETRDPVTGFAREPIHVAAWPGGKKVAVSFALFSTWASSSPD